jgi:2-haloacid dehalogenase
MTAHPGRRFDAVVFDLLTALLDSWSLWNRAAGSAERGMHWRRAYLRLTYGCGAYRPYESLVGEAAASVGLPPPATARLLAEWDTLQPWPDAPGILATLAQRGLALGVATNCSRALGLRAAARVGVPFTALVTAEQAGFYKPHPEPYRAVLAELGTAPARTLFVAGSAADVPGASGIGMAVFWHNRIELPALPDTPPPLCEATSLTPLLALTAATGVPDTGCA